jgi:hypothetical protein
MPSSGSAQFKNPQHRPSGVGEDRNHVYDGETMERSSQHRPSGIGGDNKERLRGIKDTYLRKGCAKGRGSRLKTPQP